MSSYARRCLVVVCAAALATFLALCLYPSAPPVPADVASIANASWSVPTAAAVDVVDDLRQRVATRTGDRLHLDLRLAMQLGDRDDGAAPQRLEIHHQGTLLLVVPEVEGALLAQVARFADIDTAITGLAADAPARTQMLLDERPFVVLRDADGVVVGYRFAADLAEPQRNSARAVIAALTFAIAPLPAATWTRTEPDANGMREHDYSRDPRTPERIVRRLGALSGRPDLRIDRAHACAELSDARLESVTVDEAWCVTAADGLFVAMGSTQGSLRRTATDVDASCVQRELAAQTMIDAPAMGSTTADPTLAEQAEHERWQQELATVDLTQALADLRQVLGGEPAAIHEAWERLSWLLALRPEAVAQVMAMLATSELPAELAARIITALGAARSAEAQQALFTLLSSIQPGHAEVAAIAFLQVDHPDAALLDRLLAHLPANAGLSDATATLLRVSGALAGRLADPTAAVERLLALQSRLQPGDLLAWYTALGNTGRREVLPALTVAAAEADPEVRANAAHALRGIPGEDVSTLLVALATSDPDGEVQLAAIAALGLREDRVSLLALQELASAGAAATPRIAALEALARRRSHRPDVRELIDRLVGDPDAAVARAARELQQARG